MRELYVVAVSEDGRHVLFGGSKGAVNGTFKVKLDARLISAVRGDLGLAHEVDLSPKDIQARLRKGESAEHIARSAGVAITRVERFAGPVAGEMARMIDAARSCFVVRGRRGPSTVALGKAVDSALGEAVTDWTTLRLDDGRWRIAVAWLARGRAREAAWYYDPAAKVLTAVDAASAALGHVEDAAVVRRTASKPAAAAVKVAASKPAPAKKAPAKKAPAKKAPAKKAPVKKAVAKPVRKAAPKPAKAVRKAAPKAAKAMVPRAPRKPVRPRLQVVPDPPKAPALSTPATRKSSTVPAWADVLLGTTPGNDR